ncbi:glycoside hydrolase family 70 protein [Nicoliella lavandulae]|uniref:dextransucrase n=1 Tax=Nicoliella lavandulae TaxID=3082954 RepID=A0ABU8SLL1_9LACO
MKENQSKSRYKLYKSGKNWVIASLMTISLGIGYQINHQLLVSAADDQPSTSASLNSDSSASDSSSSASAATSTSADSMVASSATSSESSANTNHADSSAVTSSSADSNSSSNSTSSDSTSSDSTSSDSASSSVNESSSSAMASSASENINVKSKPVVGISAKNTKLVKQLIKQNNVDNIKQINGKYYYVDSFGDPHTNVTVQLGKYVLSFTGKNGALVDSNQNDIEYGLNQLNNEYTEHNSFDSVDSNSITTTDGFLTSNSWYRPKDILKDGKTWTASTNTDMRPLLMTWWPNKQIEVNYLNYMNQHGIGPNFSLHEINDEQTLLDSSAQDVQKAIEQKITQNNGDTTWLKNLINTFVDSQSLWNINSENKGTDSLQGGSLLFNNSAYTPSANSNYRLINRAPANQTGVQLYNYDLWNGSEFLLANDVDNSNPVVQAEDLNWLYYMMNIGSIAKNDPDANFDGLRIDAVDNMDADLLQITADYFKDAYKTNQNDANANSHLSILEDWSKNDAYYLQKHGQNQLTIDDLLHFNMMSALNGKPGQRLGLDTLINGSLVDRTNDSTQNQAIPNYFFVRAHDSGVQDILFQIIKDKINPNSDGAHFTTDEINRALAYYDQDTNATNKQYTYYNIPASYALMLTNKDTVPRIYYGDMYTDDGQYMATKSPYFDSIQSMLTARVKYVAGGQSMAMNNGVLTSVRYGKGADTATEVGDATTRNSGIAVVESNNPNLSNTSVTIKMGASHKNQAYRPLMLTTNNGIQEFNSDAEASNNVIYTDANGNLTLNADQVKGYSNPQVSGYLSMWVPVGASDNQDVRTQSSTTNSTDGNTLHSNDALDSNVIFESFSNFQAMPQNNNQYLNAVVAKMAPTFKQWGITSVQLPPQYRSVTGNDFLDSLVQNGYAFSYRYDMGYGTPTKYGTIDQLTTAIKSLHTQGIQAIADFVPDQLYSLNGEQVVSATRVDQSGNYIHGDSIYKKLYVAKTISNGTDYQSKFGGKFLAQLQQAYPSLFTTNQLSTGQPIDASQKITQWSAKYMNGTNIQGRGSDYVLTNGVNNQYFSINGINYLPKQLLSGSATSGFVKVGKNTNYYSTSGYKVTNSFVKDNHGNLYYFDNNGNMVLGKQKINQSYYFFLPNGKALTNSVFRAKNGDQYYYGANGAAYQNGYYDNPETNNNRYFNNKGVMATGRVKVNGIYQYFDTENGDQAFGEWVGKRYYDADTGNEDTSQFATINNNWYYFDKNGKYVTGRVKINGKYYYFGSNGIQVKGNFGISNGQKHYYSGTDGSLVTNDYITVNGLWYYVDQKGNIVTGLRTVNGNKLYFDQNGVQVKGKTIKVNGKKYFTDSKSGIVYSLKNKNQETKKATEIANANTGSIQQSTLSLVPHDLEIKSLPDGGHYTSDDGGKTQKYIYQDKPIKGLYSSNGNLYYFNYDDGTEAKSQVVDVNGNYYYFNSNDGQGNLINSVSGGQYIETKSNGKNTNDSSQWLYETNDGNVLKGIQVVDGNLRYFDAVDGEQLKGGTANIGGTYYYFEPQNGDLVGTVNNNLSNGKYITEHGNTQYVDSHSNIIKGLSFINGKLQYFDLNTGHLVKNKQVYTNGATYFFDAKGNGQYLFTNTDKSGTTDFASNNAVNSTSPSDYKNTVDGFLTADSWYRPKAILDGGNTWRASTSNDFRPIIMNWWPNKNVQVNYLKLMQANGLLSTQTQYSLFTDQTILNQAAQLAQVEIERKIKQERGTSWLNDLLFKGNGKTPSFVQQQFIWNRNSEYQGQGDAWFQGGYLKYGNSPLTPTTNSKYRKADNSFDFLLANDIDNSNPAVQAEDLNWLYYMLNFGNISTNGKTKDANFDGIRIDAVDFISNETIQRIYDYLRDAYGVAKSDQKANSHLSLVEAGIDAGTTFTNSDALIESNFRNAITTALNNAPGKNESLSELIKDADSGVTIANHANNESDGGVPNYSIVHAHDKGIQENVGAAITDATGANWTNFTPAQLLTGLKAYYQDQRSTIKKYNSYNIPSSYALMLTNKGTVPRIYYGDMYQDDGQYMQTPSLYYDAIDTLMTARKRYVGGGQTMSVDKYGLLKSVRFGKGIMNANAKGNRTSRTEGIGVIVGNNPKLNLDNNDVVTLNMGLAHRNQKYRALMLTTNDGLKTYSLDQDAPVVQTDDKGILRFSQKDINGQSNTSIHGFSNPQVTGYLAAWVPVGAKDSQDARTKPSDKLNNDGKVFHSNAALDSNLIYEGFSNFQPMPTNHAENTDVVIAKNAKQFKKWGVTSFEMAPPYRSSNDHSFIDSTVSNGYAFSDRYDLGYGSPTKYGNDADLRKAIVKLHHQGIQVMADMVYNQLYDLKGQEVVSTTRAGVTGNSVPLGFGKQLYVVNSVGGGKYQKQYGGAFLKTIKQKYPDLFKAKQYDYYVQKYADNGDGDAYLAKAKSTRTKIPDNVPIKQWKAKYMNGTNVLGLGMGYVLKDWNTGEYFKLDGDHSVVPSSLTDQDNSNNE